MGKLIRRILMWVMLGLGATPAFAQVSKTLSGTTCPGAGCVVFDTGGAGTQGVQISGTFVGTLTFTQTINGTYETWTVRANGSTTDISTTTTGGLYSGSVAGIKQVKVAFTAFTSGTATVSGITSQARSSMPSSGGSSSGISAVSPTFSAQFPAVDATSFTPALAGAGAGNLSAGVYSYKFTFSTLEGETEAGAASPTVTVVTPGANGQVKLPIPLTGNATQQTFLNIYRTTAGGSAYNLVVARDLTSFGGDSFYIDNVADGSLGAVAPTTNTTLGVRASLVGDVFVPTVGAYWGDPVYMLGARGNSFMALLGQDADTPTSAAPEFKILAGAGYIGAGAPLRLQAGFSLESTGGALELRAGTSLNDAGGSTSILGGSADGAGNGGFIQILGGSAFGAGTGGDAIVSGGDGTVDGNVKLRSATVTTVRNVADNAYTPLDALGFRVAGTATSLRYLKANGTNYVESGAPAQEMAEFTTSATGTINNLDIGTASIVRFTGGSTITLTGMTHVAPGQVVTLVAAGSGNVFLAHASGSSDADKRLINKVNSGPTPLAASGSGTATYIYDGTGGFWRLASHQQGAPLTPTFAAGDYTGSGSMTWTVESGDVSQHQYTVDGNLLSWSVFIGTTTVGGTPDSYLQIAIPDTYTFNGTCSGTGWALDAGTRASIFEYPETAGTLGAQKLTGVAWLTATNTTQVVWNVTCSIN